MRGHRFASAGTVSGQVRHLACSAELPSVRLHVLPFAAIPSLASSFPFVHFQVPSVDSWASFLQEVKNGTFDR
ncbi:Scr1 family TA system antitoxin-like transcriptional regulator [Saccharopolyspora gregorii]|uniref:Scr1 family TA system antitoxin-like transcriptional regulator n=1 Tax=Saccharopolyspora gregorii TaxID=33914 RepID=UPI0031E793DD